MTSSLLKPAHHWAPGFLSELMGNINLESESNKIKRVRNTIHEGSYIIGKKVRGHQYGSVHQHNLWP